MWLLKDSKGNIKYLKPNKTINVGRKQADIILENDSSISRAHATINVTLKDQIRTSDISSTCIVKDANSKYGSFIIRNNVQTKATKEGIALQPSDTLKFGLQQHIFTVEYIHFVTVISRLSVDHKRKLKDIMDSIGGIVIDCYDDNCTHLTATTATVTTKIISALIAGIPIVDINYWISVLNAIETNDVLPDPNLFTLTLQDKGVNTQRVCLRPNPERKTLFQVKTFIFFSEKTYKEYKRMIKEAGGKVELRTVNSENISEDLFEDNNIVMQIIDESITDELATFNTMLYEKMHEKKLRMISETEIPLAIVYVSLDQYCNPKYHFKNLMKRKSPQEDTSTVLAADTQDLISDNANMSSASNSKRICIPETADFMQDDINEEHEECTEKNPVQTENNQPLRGKSIYPDKDSNNDFIKASTSKCQKEDLDENDLDDLELKDKIPKQCSTDLGIKGKNSELKVTNESAKRVDAISNKDDSSGLESGFIKRKVSSFTLEESKIVVSENQNSKDKKRPREKALDSDEMTKNEQSGWKSKEPSTSLEIHKKRKNSNVSLKRNNDDDFAELEQKKNETKEKKPNKYGFKKSEKKAIDFDLDDLDMDTDQIRKHSDKITIKIDVNVKKDLNNSLENTSSINQSKFNEGEEFNKNIETKSIDIGNIKFSKENIKDWTFPESSSNHGNNIVIKNENNASDLIRPNIKLESDIDVKKGRKVFKKVYNPIPVKRIALSDMTVWKSNT